MAGRRLGTKTFSLDINRYGFIEETHFTIAYSPVPDDTVSTGVGGVRATVHEITETVIGERRVRALRDLGARVGEAKTAEEVARDALALCIGFIDLTAEQAHAQAAAYPAFQSWSDISVPAGVSQ